MYTVHPCNKTKWRKIVGVYKIMSKILYLQIVRNGVLYTLFHLVGGMYRWMFQCLDISSFTTSKRGGCQMEAYIAAIISCVTSGVFYLIDAIMKKDTYSRASQPVAISCGFALVPSVALFALCKATSLPQPDTMPMLVAFGSGVLVAFITCIYFQIVYSDAGESTEISVFENSSVIMIALITLVLSAYGIQSHETILSRQWVGIFIAALALIGVHLWGEHLQLVDWKHRLMLILFMSLSAVNEMTIDWALHLTSTSLDMSQRTAYLVISPYYWLGLSSGVLVLLLPKERKEFLANFYSMMKSWKLIIISELIALIAFGALIYGFAVGHVAVIAVMSGSFPVVVFFGGILLRRKFGFSEKKFPIIKHPWKKGIAILVVILGITLAAWG
jgi:hypothetical protein